MKIKSTSILIALIGISINASQPKLRRVKSAPSTFNTDLVPHAETKQNNETQVNANQPKLRPTQLSPTTFSSDLLQKDCKQEKENQRKITVTLCRYIFSENFEYGHYENKSIQLKATDTVASLLPFVYSNFSRGWKPFILLTIGNAGHKRISNPETFKIQDIPDVDLSSNERYLIVEDDEHAPSPDKELNKN
jgi:hypothetical protein